MNTYLELKAENEQLQRRLIELRGRAPPQTLPAPATSQTSPIYATSSLQSQKERLAEGGVDALSSYYPAAIIPVDEPPANIFDNKLFTSSAVVAPSMPAAASTEEDEEGPKKKKVRSTRHYYCFSDLNIMYTPSLRNPILGNSMCVLHVAAQILLSGGRYVDI